jgi:hypothetical protein
MLSHGNRHHESRRVGVCDRHEYLGYAESPGNRGSAAAHPHSRLSPTRDLDVPPSDATPTSSQGLHYCFFPGEASRQPALGSGESKGVLALVLCEASFGKARVFGKHGADTFDVSQINSKAEDSQSRTNP